MEVSKEDKSLNERKPAHLWNTVMFFPDIFSCEPDSTTQQFLWYFSQARLSIRACIYTFSMPELLSIITQQYDRGIIIEFVSGHEKTTEMLRDKGILCGMLPRAKNVPATDEIMHHKFAVIDDEAVLTGSLNWTIESILQNKENVVVSTDSNHVKPLLSEFFRLKMICEKAKSYC